MGSRAAAVLILSLVAGCAGDRPDVGSCDSVTCSNGRICVNGYCVYPDVGGGNDWSQPREAAPDHAQHDHGGSDVIITDTLVTDVVTDQSAFPDPTTAAGNYSGKFFDAMGGGLVQGTLSFTLTASGAQTMTLSGMLDGTALPVAGNFKLKGTITGTVTCAAIATTIKGSIDSYGFNGALNGTLTGNVASGTWNGQQTGGPIALAGIWNAARQ